MRGEMLVGVIVGSILLTSVVVGTGTAEALTSTSDPQLTLERLIRTSPFPGTSTRMFDNEGSAYVAGDNALWMADDQSDSLLEVDRTTGALRRRIPQAAFIYARSVGAGPSAGQSRNEDLEALAYDADADVLYAFSGVTPWGPSGQRQPSFPTVYRLTRVAGEFQVAVMAGAAVGVDRCGLARRRRPHLRREPLEHPHLRLRHEHAGGLVLDPRALQDPRDRLRRRDR